MGDETMQLPRLQELDDTPLYNTRAVVRMTLVQAPRLRAWERRYQILAPHRSSNSYRLYSERDLAIIRWLRDQVDAGMTISQATSYLRLAVETGHAPPALIAPPDTLHLEEMAHHLVDAALQFDELTAISILRHAFAVHSVEDVCQILISPALFAMGQLWEKNNDVIVSEHFLSGLVRAQLTAIWQITYQPVEGPLVVIGCAPGENHELGAFVLALFLRRQGVRVAYLGQSLETISMVHFVEENRPSIVCLSVTLAQHAAATLALARDMLHIPGVRIVVGGQGITRDALNGLASHIIYLDTDGVAAVDAIKRIVPAL